MLPLLFLLLLLLPLSAQNLVVNYLGGTGKASTALAELITERAAIGVSPDGRMLYVTQASQGVVRRYDLRARTVDIIAVPGLAESRIAGEQSVTGIAVSDEAALIPVGTEAARIVLDGKVTIPGHRFVNADFTTDTTPVTMRAFAFPQPLARLNVPIFYGIRNTNRGFYYPQPTRTQFLGSLGSCSTSFPPCDNSALAAGPLANFRSNQIWGVAFDLQIVGSAQQLQLYVTDAAANSGNFGSVALIRSQTLTVIAHPTSSNLPMGSSGARLSRPTGVAVDSSSNLYVADTGNHRILRRTPDGVWSVYAGTGVRGSGGDGGPAVNAELFEPKSLTIDTAGTLYIHDSGNGALRRVLPDGIIERINVEQIGQTETLIRDLQLPAVAALATDASGQVYAVSQARIVKVDPRGRATYIAGTGQYAKGGEGVVAADSPIDITQSLTIDPEGGLVFAEQFRIRRIDPSGIVSTIAGNGVQAPVDRTSRDPDPAPALTAYLQPTAVSTAADGSLLIVDGSWLRRFRAGEITSVTGVPWCGGVNEIGSRPYADGIPAIFACIGRPNAFIGAPDGQLYFDDTGTTTAIRVIDPEGFISTRANLQGMRVSSMAAGPNGSLYAVVFRNVANQLTTTNYLLVRISADGQVTRLSSDARTADVQPLKPGQPSAELVLYGDSRVASDARGFVYLWDSITRRITVFGEPVSVEVDSVPSGLEVMVDGVTVTTPRTFQWLPGDYHTVTAGGEGFLGWSHAPADAAAGTPSVTWLPPGGASKVVATFGDPAAVRQRLRPRRPAQR